MLITHIHIEVTASNEEEARQLTESSFSEFQDDQGWNIVEEHKADMIVSLKLEEEPSDK